MNADLVKRALEKVGNPHILINLISRRVRQLNAGSGGISRPLVTGTENMGIADIALREIVEGKMDWVIPEPEKVTRPANRKVKGIKPAVKAMRSAPPPTSNVLAA
jgi:DNA-directed RNA polymerase subunit omega